MRIFVKAKSGSKENKVVPPPLKLISEAGVEEYFTVFVKDPPVQGRANDAIIKQLAKHFSVSISQVRLLRGTSSKIKVFEIIGL
ncbi:MAG: DUF167 domain-containing protein [Parcubacteria group bacterium]